MTLDPTELANKVMDRIQGNSKKDNIKTTKNNDERNKLNSYANSSIYEADYYKKALNDIQELKVYIQNAKRYRADKNIIISNSYQKALNILTEYRKNVKRHISELKEWQKDYIKNFEKEFPQYDNPTTELLKRQDFTSKINSMTTKELFKYVDNLDNHKPLGVYETNYLLGKTKDNTELHSKVLGYGISNNIGREYMNTPEWKTVEEKIETLNTYEQSNGIYTSPDKEGRPHRIDLMNLGKNETMDYNN